MVILVHHPTRIVLLYCIEDAVRLGFFPKQEYACRKVRELGLESGEAIDATVLEGKIYRHLDAMRYRLRLLQTLVSLTSHVITQAQVRSPLAFHFPVGSFFQG